MEAILAHDLNCGIGYKNKIPWKNKTDMRFFMEKTKNNIVVMGSKTFESLSKKLSNRLNIVLTTNLQKYSNINDEDIIFTSDIEFIINLQNNKDKYKEKFNYLNENTKIFIIGGEMIYNLFIVYCDIVWITVINNIYNTDRYFNYKIIDKEFERSEIFYDDNEIKIYKYIKK